MIDDGNGHFVVVVDVDAHLELAFRVKDRVRDELTREQHRFAAIHAVLLTAALTNCVGRRLATEVLIDER